MQMLGVQTTWLGYLFVVFVTTTTSLVMTMGPIVAVTKASSGATPAAVVAGVQAVASLCALLLGRLLGSRAFRLDTLSFGMLALAGTATTASLDFGPWALVGLFFRQMAGVQITSRLLAEMRAFSGVQSIAQANKRTQTVSMVATLVGFASSPLLVSSLGAKGVLAFDGMAIALSMFAILFPTPNSEQEKPSSAGLLSAESEISTPRSQASALSKIFFVSLLCWIFLGTLNIVEVPHLLQWHRISANELSIVFALAGAASIAAVTAFPSRLFSKVRIPWNVVTGLLMACTLPLFLAATNIVWATLAIVLAGAFNGFFNLAQSHIIQTFATPQARTSGYVLNRLGAQLGTFLGAVALVSIPSTELVLRISTALFSVYLLCALLLFFRPQAGTLQP